MSFLWEKLARPVLFRMDAERAHEIGIKALRFGLNTRPLLEAAAEKFAVSPFGLLEHFGLQFPNPLGIAAGFDKNCRVVYQLAALGFGSVEVGTVTFEPQSGNEKPRLFRLPDDKALINRLGFNNDGANKIAQRLNSADEADCVIGVNIGKNKDVPIDQAVENYLYCFEQVMPAADYVAVNVSSPNTPNLRELQRSENLEELLAALQKRNREMSEGGPVKPLLVKIAPDLSEGEIEAAVDICRRHGIAGIIATNTTISREGLKTKNIEDFGAGGLSGKPLAKRSNEVISTIYRYSNGKLPIVGVGGIFTAEDAFEKIAAGASLLQAYTGFVYGGPSFARTVNEGLAEILKQRGFDTLDDAIGSGVG
jgi:dihydroorotate dehydrogenase